MNIITCIFFCFGVCCMVNGERQVKECAASISAFPPDPKTGCCGIHEVTQRTEGRQTAIDEYPWLALIEYASDGELRVACGGSLISGKYVLTAAYCVKGSPLPIVPKNIRLGEYDVSHEGPDCAIQLLGGEDCSDGAIRIPIEKTIPHPQYNSRDRSKRNDIALVRMAETAPFTDFIRPICLPTVDIAQAVNHMYLTLSGWGSTDGLSSVKLQVDLPLVSQEKCQLAYSPFTKNLTLWQGQLCAGGEKGKDSCSGDGGMPLMYENGNTYEVSGVVSFGAVRCGAENIPSVYTNVYEYKSWILSNITP